MKCELNLLTLITMKAQRKFLDYEQSFLLPSNTIEAFVSQR